MYLVFEYFGERLADVAAHHPELVVQALDVVYRICCSPILHNDIKPEHFFVKRDPDTGKWRYALPVTSSSHASTVVKAFIARIFYLKKYTHKNTCMACCLLTLLAMSF